MAWERERERVMRQETSGVLAFRVLVMLSCLILVPAAAIFGSAFPELVQKQLVERLKSLANLLPQEEAAPPADPRTAAPPLAAAGTTATWGPTEAAPAWQPAIDSHIQPAAYPATAHQVEYSDGEPTAMPAGLATVASSPASRSPARAAPLANPASAPQATNSGDHFTEIQARLRDYGASYYALESVGKQGELYRFACTMADPNGHQRSFSVTDRDPLQAMHRVMRDVEAWRGQALAPTGPIRR